MSRLNPYEQIATKAHDLVRSGDYRMGYLTMCEAYGKLAALTQPPETTPVSGDEVERVARAICIAEDLDPDGPHPEDAAEGRTDGFPLHVFYANAARAAINALRPAEVKPLIEEIRLAITYHRMPMATRMLLDRAAKALTTQAAPQPTDQQPKVIVPMYGTSAERGAAPEVERKWFPHRDFTGDWMLPGNFREPYPMDEEIAAIRNAALEEAARVAEGANDGLTTTHTKIAAAIRGLVKEVG